MKPFFHESLSKFLNHYLMLDPESSVRLGKLEGKSFQLIFLSVGLALYLKIEKGQFFSEEEIERPDVIIKGTPFALLRVSLMKKNRKKLFAEDVTIEGNLELGQQLIDLFDEMDIDWEEYFSRVVGDVSANQIGEVFRTFKKIIRRVSNNLLEAVTEYLHEESNLACPPEALNDFYHDIDQLRFDVDRLEARIQRLIQRDKKDKA